MVRRKGAVRSIRHTVPDLPVGDELAPLSVSYVVNPYNILTPHQYFEKIYYEL
jgi:hypothetical protein